MHPRLFRFSDLSIMAFPAVIVGLITVAIAWNLTSPEGEAIPAAGWFVSSLVVLMCLGISFEFYRQRWLFLRNYKFTTRYGVSYFFEPGAIFYLLVDVEEDTEVMLSKWRAYIASKNDGMAHGYDVSQIMSGACIKGSICTFKKGKSFDQNELNPSWIKRQVYGISGWNWAVVAQNDSLVRRTAHRHELAHIHLARTSGGPVTEEEAHRIFAEAGIS